MSQFPKKIICPHCEAVNTTYGWANTGQCHNCHLWYKVDLNNSSDSYMEDAKEFIQGVFHDEEKIAKFVDK